SRGSRSAGGFFLFGFRVRLGVAEHLLGLVGGRLQHAALGAVSPLDLVVLELGRGEAGRLQGSIALDLGAGAPHELLRAPRDEQHEPQLAIDSVGHGLNHSFPFLSDEMGIAIGSLYEDARGRLPGARATVSTLERRILTQEWPDPAPHSRYTPENSGRVAVSLAR